MYEKVVGSRTGTCREHPLCDLAEVMKPGARERPLTAVDVTLSGHMSLGYDSELVDLIAKLRNLLLLYKGDFSLLWRNSELWSDDQRRVFEREIRFSVP